MTAKEDALSSLKTIVTAIDPSPQDAPAGVWVYPTDYASVSLVTLPIVLISEELNVEQTVSIPAYGGASRDSWTIEIIALLAKGMITREDQAAQVELLHAPWPKAMEQLLYNTSKLSGTPDTVIGLDDTLFRYTIGHVNWWDQVYWGIRFIIPAYTDFLTH